MVAGEGVVGAAGSGGGAGWPGRRDPGLDLVKGIACVAMLVAHVWAGGLASGEPGAGLGWTLNFLGGYAPVLFYAVAGVTTLYQLRQRSFGLLVRIYAGMFVLGYLYAWVWHPGAIVADILQIIAMGVVATAGVALLLDRIGSVLPAARWAVWLCLAPIPFLLHLMGRRLHLPFPVAGFLFVPGVFPIFPWLSFFWWGIFAYGSPGRWRTGALLAALLVVAGLFFGAGEPLEKWNMNLSYYALGVALIMLALRPGQGAETAGPARAMPRLGVGGLVACGRGAAGRWLHWLGRYSLVFLFAHLALNWALSEMLGSTWGGLHYVWKWPLALAASSLLMAVHLWVNRWLFGRLPWEESCWPWVVLLLAGLAAGYRMAGMSAETSLAILYATGLVWAANYHRLSRLVQSWFGGSAPPRRPEGRFSRLTRILASSRSHTSVWL